MGWLYILSSVTVVNTLPDFLPIPGAPGYQVGNPSALALTALLASLEIFAQTSMPAIRAKSIAITAYLQSLLRLDYTPTHTPYRIITPSDPAERGAQLSVQLKPGLLEGVMKELEDNGVVVDERKPDVVRVAPAPLYNTYREVWEFVGIFKEACRKAEAGLVDGAETATALQGKEKGWGLVK
jgi:kynureninase